MYLESPKVTLEKSQEDTINFLADIKNFELLMPENISKFEVLSEDTFIFALKGMPEIVLRKKELDAPDKIVFGAAGGKLDFSLIYQIDEIESNKSEVQLHFEGDFNPMMAMMIKGPINKLLETLVTNLPKEI